MENSSRSDAAATDIALPEVA